MRFLAFFPENFINHLHHGLTFEKIVNKSAMRKISRVKPWFLNRRSVKGFGRTSEISIITENILVIFAWRLYMADSWDSVSIRLMHGVNHGLCGSWHTVTVRQEQIILCPIQ